VCNYPTVTIFQGEKLRQARAAAGLTQKELADRAGIQRETVNHAENGKHLPGSETLARIAKALDVSIDSLFSDNGEAVA
jgi:putative transcriptional regulator